VATIDLSQENFQQVVDGNDMVLLDFWAPWCGPCRSFAPAYEQLSEKYPDIVFAKINTEEEQTLAAMFQVRSIPTLVMFREKIIVFAQPGALPASALEQILVKARALDMDQVRRDIETERATEDKGTKKTGSA
jgi:thioredoxin 1